MPDIHVYILVQDEFDIRTRMFAPLDGIPEDPATGSANCALVAMLSHYRPERDGQFRWRIAQGVEMGRPSVLDARTEKQAGTVAGVWIGGDCKMVTEGYIKV
jgi:trans-2,3-dihydro-3-hydroxyanthranilate isomerase